VPLRSAASITTVPRLSAAITLFLIRNPGLVGLRSGGISLTSTPCAAMASNNSKCPLG